MSPQSHTRDYKAGSAPYETGSALAAVDEFLQRLARAIRAYHTYPVSSPLCADAIASCHAALVAVGRADRLTFRVTPHELVIDETGIGTGTIIEQEFVRRLHRAGVATLDIDHAAAPRDLARLCEDVIRCDAIRDADATFADLLVEHGVETIVARMARRPEVLNVGVPAAPLREFVDHDQRRRRLAPATGPVDYLYPPEKGWIRVDPAVRFDALSLVDLAVLVDDPGDMASMLLRLTDDDPGGAVGGDQALEQKFGDVAMLFSALDPHLARIMFGKLARAVLAIDADRRTALLRRTILPGLLEGRVDGAVLRDFPDPDLAESLCLLLELETAAPEVVSAALNKLELPADRRQAIAALVDERVRGGLTAAASSPDHSVDRYARRLVQIEASSGRNFAEFAAFDLSTDDRHRDALAAARDSIEATDVTLAQLDCLTRLVRLEPNPTLVKGFMRVALGLLGDLHRTNRWRDLAESATRFRRLTYELNASRPDVAAAIDAALGDHWTNARIAELLEKETLDAESRAIVRALVEAFGPCVTSGFVSLLEDPPSPQAMSSLLSLMCEHALLLGPGLAAHAVGASPAIASAIVRVLGYAGHGYEAIIAAQLTRGDEQLTRASLRALTRIGTPRAAALVAFQIQSGGAVARAAEAALWQFPPAQATAQIRELLSHRDFVMHNPAVVGRLLDRASQWDTADLDGVLGELEGLRFRVWNPDVVRMARKAKGLRGR